MESGGATVHIPASPPEFLQGKNSGEISPPAARGGGEADPPRHRAHTKFAMRQ